MRFLGILLLVLLLLAGAAAGYVWYSIERPFGHIPADGVFVEIPHGTSRRAASRILEHAGLIRSAEAFEFYARRHPRRSLQAGEYFFDHPVTGKEVFWKLANGEVYSQPFTVREGQTMFDIAQALEAAKIVSADDFLRAAGDASSIQDIAPGAKTLEGFLFPATYGLPRKIAPADLTAMMVRKFRDTAETVFAETRGSSALPSHLLGDVTLASLVERETPKPEERPLVASVYSNRLTKGMLLQCDPTVIYALEQVGGYKGTLTLKDLRFDSPYNTYLYRGLPPGPIGNPGAASLRAALHPAQSDYLYFVANTQGGHFFSTTLAEHNQNVVKYHRLLAGQSADPPPATTAQHKSKPGSTHKGRQ